MIRMIGSRLGELDWSTVAPGDVVQVPYRATPYNEKILLFGNGFTLVGLPGPNGERPIIDGTNATTDPQFQFPTDYRLIEDAGLIAIYHKPGQTTRPSNITIDGFEIRGASLDNAVPTYTTFDGLTRTYDISAAGIYGVAADNITVKNCTIHANGNGVLVIGSQNCRAWTLASCNIYDNGKIGSDRQHGTYCEVLGGIVYDGMTYGPNRVGSLGGLLKDRSCGPVVTNCTFTGGARMIDFSQPQDTIAQAVNDPQYLRAVVQNCWLKNTTGGSVMFVYAEPRPGHVVNLLGTTFDVIRDQSDTWRLILADIETDGPTSFAFDHCLIRAKPVTAGAAVPEVSASNGIGGYSFNPCRTDGVTLLKSRTGVPDNGRYFGWENVGPGDETGFGYAAPVPTPPPAPPVVWTEAARSRIENGDTAVDTILYRRSS